MILTLTVSIETADSYVISVLSFFYYFVVRRTRCLFSSKIELLFSPISLNLTLLRSLGLKPLSCHKYTSL